METEIQNKEIARMNFRLSAEVKEKATLAAHSVGLSLTDFVIHALTDKAAEVLERQHRRVLSDRDRDRFLEMLENPPAPNQALLAASDDYRRRVKK